MGQLTVRDPERALVPVSGPGAGHPEGVPRIENEIDVSRIVRGLLARKRSIILTTVVFTALLAVPAYLFIKPVWIGTARIIVQPVRGLFAGTPLETHPFAQGGTDTVVELLIAEPVLDAAANELGGQPEDVFEAIEFRTADRSPIISVDALATTGKRASEIANAFVDSTVAFYHSDLRQLIEAAQQAAKGRVGAARKRSKESQDSLTMFVVENGFYDEAEIDTVLERVATADSELGTLRARLAGVESQMDRTAELLADEKAYVSSVSSTTAPRSSGSVFDQIRPPSTGAKKGARKGKAKGEASGWLKKRKSKSGGSTRTVSPNPIHQNLYMARLAYETEGVALRNEIDRLQSRLTELVEQRDQLPLIRREYQALVVERDFALEELDKALTALAAVDNVARRPDPLFRIVERAEPPKTPTESKRKLAVVLAGMLALAGSFGLALTAELRDGRVRSRSEIERLGLQVFATVYELDDGGPTRPKDVEAVANSLRRDAAGRGPQCYLFTSADSLTGKSRLVRGVSKTLVDWDESVLRVDANFHEGSGESAPLDRYLLGESEQPGLLRYPDGSYALASGGPRTDSPALLASEWMGRLLERARSSFSITLLDGPSLRPGVDAELLAERVDGVVLVIRADRSDMAAVRDAVVRLRTIGAPLRGAVLVSPMRLATKAERAAG